MPHACQDDLAFPHWRQPVGAWRARGAQPCALRIGLGLAVRDIPSPAPLDNEGFSLWHYWANSPSPQESFAALFLSLGETHSSHLARDGIHPWHYLLSHGNPMALETWVARLGLPAEPPPTSQGDTLAHCAAWSGDPESIGLFSERELSHINHVDNNGLTPLMIAIHRGGQALAQAFLMAGADPMVCNDQGRNALHHAAQYGDLELIAFLEDAGGDADVADHQGLCPRDIARTRRGLSEQERQSLAEHWARRGSGRLVF